MSERGTTDWSFSETYCCLSREPSLASMLNLTDPADSVAEYSFTGIDTRPKRIIPRQLARELDLQYACVALVANWAAGCEPRQGTEPVAPISLPEIFANLEAATALVPKLIAQLLTTG